ncbi:exportin-2 [Ziziphus jujuba]|uniref:Exportin-2 n=2 Tax=Ziziphus jujuba TaxID=326968 RepID=A0A6P6FZR6_ZIZJJ|nr:exportin-2 [Ziziphus jujuba]XP_024926960.2 exportin-2 [Ziziphus jujuba]KAH7543014.1 hypothetical protein FEM48_Zijuj02G0137600 [Ziziphus jujuba var. spinosa]
MEWNQQTLEFLSNCFLHTLSPSPEPRRRAEALLLDASHRPNYAFAVLCLVAEPSVDEQIRQSAAINFKNHLRHRWAPADETTPILDSEKEPIKALIVSLMLSSTPPIQTQLSEALAIIGNHDFPRSWPALLPELVSSLHKASQASDYASINGILGTANSIFKKFRYQFKTNDLLLDLKYSLENFSAPLLEIFLKTAALIDSSSSAIPNSLGPLFESQRLCCRIFYSLNFQDLPEFFEDHMKEWMTEFRKYLITNYAVAVAADGLAALVDDLRAAVCENINLYMEKNEEEFRCYLKEFVSAVWILLGNMVSQASSNRDQLAITAIKFLTTVSTSVHHALFEGEGVIQQICQSIVIPNVRLRDDDEELFEMNYVEFIRRDMEGSDLDTRRRIACELLKGIATNYKNRVANLVSIHIHSLANPVANWKDKDCAICLVVSLATKKAGGNSVSTDLVDVQNFFGSVIVPELQSPDVNGFPMLKAGALKFFTMFRNHIPKQAALQLFPDLIRFLGAESNVVHSYAAICIEKLLLVKDEGGRARFNADDVSPFFISLRDNLFIAMKFPESEENQYVMKCIMRVLGVADVNGEIAGRCIDRLKSILSEVCRNPKNPIFNHYLFESVAILVKRACEKDSSLISAFEGSLFPSLEMILVNDVTEFFPYAFQLLAQLVELNRPPFSPSYMRIFKILLSPDSWNRASNVPAFVRLLQAFLQKAPHELNQDGRIGHVLEIFEKLVSLPGSLEQGFYVLNTVIENLEYSVLERYICHIWEVLFKQLQHWQTVQSRKTVKLVKHLLILMSLFIIKHGSNNLVDTIHPNLFKSVLENVWIPNLKNIRGAIETKLTSVASTRLICESPRLLDATAVEHWGKMLDGIVTLLSEAERDRIEDEREMPDIDENVGYTTTFVRLYNAGKKEEDPLKDVKDPKEFLVVALARLSAIYPGRFPQIIWQYLNSDNQAALLHFCSTYNCQIL